ncbi:MAG: triacylglycerol lipase, partial [Pseudomonadota bacterium]
TEGIFSYKGQEASELVIEAMQLVEYSYHGLEEGIKTSYAQNGYTLETLAAGIFGTGSTEGIIAGNPDSEARARELVESQGWTVLTPEDLGISNTNVDQYGTFHGETSEFQDASADVLAKYDENGEIEQLGFVIRGTSGAREDLLVDTIGDTIDYLEFFRANPNYTFDAFENLLGAVKNFAIQNNVAADDILITGHSLGGGAVVNMAENSDEYFDGFFVDADYLGVATFYTPEDGVSVLESGAEIYSFDFENDPVPSVIAPAPHVDLSFLGGIFGSTIADGLTDLANNLLDFNIPYILGNDIEYEYSNENIIIFNDLYDTPVFQAGGDWFNAPTWSAHLMSAYTIGAQQISTSYFYDEMERDSLVIVSNLSDARRENTWVEDIELHFDPTGHHGDGAFILGSKHNDKLRGQEGDDALDGFEGNDHLVGGRGNDRLVDGAGRDVLDGGIGADTFIFVEDGELDTITRFEDGKDLIDISDWGVTDISQLTISEVEDSGLFGLANLFSNHVKDYVIEYGDEELHLEARSASIFATATLDSSDFIFA